SLGPTLRRLARYFRPYWLVLLVVLAMMIGNAWVQVIVPMLTGQAVDCFLSSVVTGDGAAAPIAGGAPSAAQANCWYAPLPPTATRDDLLRGLLALVLVLVGLQVVGAITGGLMFYLMTWAGQRVLRRLQVDLFEHMQSLSLGYYSRHESGDLMSRITNDASTIQQAVGFALMQVLSGSL